MISVEQAWEKIALAIRARSSRKVTLAEALDCFATADLRAQIASPPFDNSAMDGYAVVAEGSEAGMRLKVIGEQPAGLDQNLSVLRGQAVRIFTGAPLPTGSDAVVMQEDVDATESEIVLREKVEPGEFVRRRGGDLAIGQQVLAVGERITPQKLALLAAQGIGKVEVGGEVRATLISTGDELARNGRELAPGQIYDANAVLLRALLQKCGVREVNSIHCADQAEEIEAAVRTGCGSDVMIITGGVSVGARDFVKGAIAAAGGAVDLWRVAVKPGKPFLFGRAAQCAIFGLPGNPVSAFVTFLLFVRPALLKLQGANDEALGLPLTRAELMVELSNDGERPHYIRGALSNGTFQPIGRQESHALFGLSRSNALLLVRPGENFARGGLVSVVTWD